MIAEKLACVLYGGSYHPEQWPESVWQEDVKLMRHAGVNLVSLGLFSWARLQPAPDTFAFDWLDRIADLLQQNGIYFNLSTGTASPPAWLARSNPESLPQNRHGNRYQHGSCHHYCPNSSAYRSAGARLARELAGRYGRHPGLVLWQVNHRYGNHPGLCYCAACAGRFREWLKGKYGSLEALNEQWCTAFWSQWYHSWEEIEPPRLTPAAANPGQQLDYRRFMNDSLLECFLNEKAALKEAAPEIPVTTVFGGPHGMPKNTNCFQWAAHVDVVSFANYPDPRQADPADIAFSLDLQRGLKQGEPWLLMEQAPSQVNWRRFNALKRPGQMRLWSCQALARGADGVLFDQWRAPQSGAGKFTSAMLPPGGAATRIHAEVSALGRELAGLAAVCGGRTRADIGLIIDWENYWAVELDHHPAPLDYCEIVRHYYRALFEPDLAIDIIQPESDLSRYKLVIAPALYLVRDGVAENLTSFVAKGGTLVMSFFSGMVDLNDRVLSGGFTAPFRRFLGIHVEEIETLDPLQTRHLRTHERGGKCGLWFDMIELEGAEVVATFADDFFAGRPAITRNAFGHGLAYYVGTQVEMEFLRRLLVDICEETGIRPPLRVPPGIEAVSRENEQGRFLFLLNHTTASHHIDLGSQEGLELLSNQPIGGSFPLGPRDVKIIQMA